MESKIIENNDEGMLHIRGNELCIDSKIPQGDAAAIRIGAKKVDGGSGGGGLLAFDLLEGAGSDEPHKASRKCMGLVTVAQDPAGRQEFTFHALKQNGQSVDKDMLKWLRITTGPTPEQSFIEFLFPSNAGGNRQRLFTVDGTRCWQLQNDGGWGPDGTFIVYDTTNPAGWRATAYLRPVALPGTRGFGEVRPEDCPDPMSVIAALTARIEALEAQMNGV